MTNETIDKYLDQQGITSGEWRSSLVKRKHEQPSYLLSGRNPETKGSCYIVLMSVNDHHVPTEEDALVIANSRKSLRDWIMVAWELNEKYTKTIPATEMYILVYAESNIEASLGKSWSEVRAELEGMEG